MPEIPVYFPKSPQSIELLSEKFSHEYPYLLEIEKKDTNVQLLSPLFKLLFDRVTFCLTSMSKELELVNEAFTSLREEKNINWEVSSKEIEKASEVVQSKIRKLLGYLLRTKHAMLYQARVIEGQRPGTFAGFCNDVALSLDHIETLIRNVKKTHLEYLAKTQSLISFYASDDFKNYYTALFCSDNPVLRGLDTLEEMHHIVTFGAMFQPTLRKHLYDQKQGYKLFALSDLGNHKLGNDMFIPRKFLIRNMLLYFFNQTLEEATAIEERIIDIFQTGSAKNKWAELCQYFGFDVLRIVTYAVDTFINSEHKREPIKMESNQLGKVEANDVFYE